MTTVKRSGAVSRVVTGLNFGQMTSFDRIIVGDSDQNISEAPFLTDTSMKSSSRSEESENQPLQLCIASELPYSTNCLACSEDGRYLALGHSKGLSVWCASTFSRAADWLEGRVEITSIQMGSMAEAAYLLATIDDMGVARVFAFHCGTIHLLSVVNVMDDIDNRSICLSFVLSVGGQYGAATFSCNGAVWLEVYLFPFETWLRELERTVSQPQVHTEPKPLEDGEGEKWSQLSAAIKIKPPAITPGSTPQGPHAVQVTDFLTHFSVLEINTRCRHPEEHSNISNLDKRKQNESTRCCTHHFLLPCGQYLGETEAKRRRASPVALCVWWSGGHNLLQYSLQRTPKKKMDAEPLPDMLWPNAKEILCSAVSRCTRYIAVGLDDALVCIWDRNSGCQLSVLTMSECDSPVSRILFLDNTHVPADELQLLFFCRSGAVHTVTTGRGTQPCIELLSQRPKESGDMPTLTTLVPFLQSTVLMIRRNGRILLHGVSKQTPVHSLIPPHRHVIATPCNPVFALNNKTQTVFIRGNQECNYSITYAKIDTTDTSHLLYFRFGECDVLKPSIVSPARHQQQTLSYTTLEEHFNLYLQDRARTADERIRAYRQTWRQLQDSVPSKK